jgi:hypothetical protein
MNALKHWPETLRRPAVETRPSERGIPRKQAATLRPHEGLLDVGCSRLGKAKGRANRPQLSRHRELPFARRSTKSSADLRHGGESVKGAKDLSL